MQTSARRELREEALQRAAAAVRRRQASTSHHPEGESPSEALEAVLGPLDWSLDGDGFRLLRELLRRVEGRAGAGHIQDTNPV